MAEEEEYDGPVRLPWTDAENNILLTMTAQGKKPEEIVDMFKFDPNNRVDHPKERNLNAIKKRLLLLKHGSGFPASTRKPGRPPARRSTVTSILCAYKKEEEEDTKAVAQVQKKKEDDKQQQQTLEGLKQLTDERLSSISEKVQQQLKTELAENSSLIPAIKSIREVLDKMLKDKAAHEARCELYKFTLEKIDSIVCERQETNSSKDKKMKETESVLEAFLFLKKQ